MVFTLQEVHFWIIALKTLLIDHKGTLVDLST